MNEFAPLQNFLLLETVLDVILDGLNIVICNLFYFLHFGCVCRSHCSVNVSESFELRSVEIGKLGLRDLTKSDDILDFHANAVLDEGILAEKFPKWLSLTRIASVDR